MKKMIVAMLLLGIALSPITAFAGFEASSWTEEESYFGKTLEKLEFGAKNLLLGILDVFMEPKHAADEDKSVILGVLKGIVDAPLNIVEGALHVVTFPIPVDLPLPDGGVSFETAPHESNPNDFKVNLYERSQARV